MIARKFQILTMLLCLLPQMLAAALLAGEVIDIGSRRQLFVDQTLIGELNGARQVLHRPVRREAVITAEHPWEKGGVSYLVTYREQGKFRAWYRADDEEGRDRTAYAESDDGIHWTKPRLGIIEFAGSKQNNLVWDGPGSNMAPFLDANPAAAPQERYKAIVRTKDVLTLVSSDGLHWRLAQPEPILTDGPFDSHNVAFWDAATEQYVAYTRGVRTEGPLGRGMESQFFGGVRWVRRSTSPDFRRWSRLEPIQTGDAPREEFYTNAAIRYDRAPDYLLMFPSRFVSGREPKPGWPFGKGVDDVAFLSSRDGLRFDRTFLEAFVRPGSDEDLWHERALYMERGILETSPTELSMYAMEAWRTPGVRIRRLTLRPDGFASIAAGYEGGEFVTRPFRFSGAELRINYSTSAVGSLRVEIQDEAGRAIPGYAAADCPEMFGDRLDQTVKWTGGQDATGLARQAIRLRFLLADADLYAIRFQ